MKELIQTEDGQAATYLQDYASFRSELHDAERGFEFLLQTLATFWKSVSLPMTFTPDEARHVLAAINYAVNLKAHVPNFVLDCEDPLLKRMPVMADLQDLRAKFAGAELKADSVRVALTRWDAEQTYWALDIARLERYSDEPFNIVDVPSEYALVSDKQARDLQDRIEELRPWIAEPICGLGFHFLERPERGSRPRPRRRNVRY